MFTSVPLGTGYHWWRGDRCIEKYGELIIINGPLENLIAGNNYISNTEPIWVCITHGVGLVGLTLRSQQFADFLSLTSLPRLYHGGDHRTVRRSATSLLPLVYKHPSLVLLVLSIFLYVPRILSGYPLKSVDRRYPRR